LLPHLEPISPGRCPLRGRFVCVRNAGAATTQDPATGAVRVVSIGNAQPNAEGDFLFEPGRGGARLDKVAFAGPMRMSRSTQASPIGEVNTYFHLDRIASYIDELLHHLGAPSLPLVIAVVSAHDAATEQDGIRDGVRKHTRWLPFQGGHYRLPSRHYDID